MENRKDPEVAEPIFTHLIHLESWILGFYIGLREAFSHHYSPALPDVFFLASTVFNILS